ncbi:MAG: amidohydrolase, partial [bacterium]|nr:amidohydrolase [bacterium]
MKKISIAVMICLGMLAGFAPDNGALAAKPGAEKRAGKAKAKKKAAQDEQKTDDGWDVSAPPGDWMTVPIDTEETTWTSVDVSPDGGMIVFDMLGDLYTVPIAGGEATALTSGIAWDVEPRFSPDGAQIAFISDREGGDNLWIMNADGSQPRAVTEEQEHLVHNPSWSSDGDYLVAKKDFTSQRSIPAGEIWLFHAGGGGGLQLIERPDGPQSQKNIAEPAFSPDGRYVYFSQDTTPGRVWQYNKDSTGRIFVVRRLDRETGEVEVFVDGPGGAIRPTPSPDGKYLAFVKRTPAFTSALYLKDLESGKEWAIYDPLDRDLQEADGSYGNTPAFAWTPDGSALVFWAGGKIRRVDVGTREASVVPVRVRVGKKVLPALRFPVAVAPDTFAVRALRWAQRS